MDAHADRPWDAYTGWLNDFCAYTDRPGDANITWIKHSISNYLFNFLFMVLIISAALL